MAAKKRWHVGPRRYFRKAVAQRNRPKHRPKPPKAKGFVAAYVRVEGRLETRSMGAREAERRLKWSETGQLLHLTGRAHRWTHEEARQAALKSWKKRNRKKRRKARQNRQEFRMFYATHPTSGIRYSLANKCWQRDIHTDSPRVISERQALRLLGHVSSNRGYIPEKVKLVKGEIPRGTFLAQLERTEE